MENKQRLTLWRRFRNNYWLALVFDAVLIISVFLAIGMWQARDLLPPGSEQTAPVFSLPDRQGNIVNLEDFRGKRVVVYFFAPWCKICSLSMHNLVDVAAKRDPDLVILALGVEYQQESEIWAFVDKHELQMPVLLGGSQQMIDWKIQAFPTYYVLNEAGQIISRSVGYSTELGIRWRSRER
ncbi:MAG: TlpA family protein disulfide reductase [Xanthomonadales bacterium]|nr:TlpA family protein disulfide reductase [Xanthomonadales bacterium]